MPPIWKKITKFGSREKTTEILLKVALNTINLNLQIIDILLFPSINMHTYLLRMCIFMTFIQDKCLGVSNFFMSVWCLYMCHLVYVHLILFCVFIIIHINLSNFVCINSRLLTSF